MGEIQRGQAITFRVPSDTPDHLLKQLQKLKETERRNFSRTIADYVLNGVGDSLAKERETLTIPLPKKLTQAQRNWLKHEHSEALLGSILYQLIANPMRAASLLASLNSGALDIDQALYLQETEPMKVEQPPSSTDKEEEEADRFPASPDSLDDDLANFNWQEARQEMASSGAPAEEDEEESLEDLLGDFLNSMNK
ncbi:hypothetical protein ACFO4N_15235 [Camelliibacillus cellulosilyticus]|uniref:Plasmid segregation centromere-binding protein ParR n=1 Tax=Camelliibacillus cellulosilyticus TaxID=2174486 RepID=A0ABV9GTM8_9BACL